MTPPPQWFENYSRRIGDPSWLDPGFQVKFKPGGDKQLFASNPGPQTWGLLCPYSELLLGGRRGGGKSKLLIATFAMGDPTLSRDDPAYWSYLNDRDFRGLFLREEFQNMAEFVEEAVEFFRPFGGKPTGKPTIIDFPKTGARIYFNHLGDEEAFNKYKGWNLTKIGVEELTQIQTLRRYLKLLGSLRSVERIRNGKTFPKLRTQIISTTNPDGPGAPWVKDRFVKVRDGSGKLIPWNTPMRDPISGMTRIYVPFGLDDNPYLRDNKEYRGMLMAQDEVTRKQWMEGDWDAGAGQFFREYRPDGPMGDEEQSKYPWARHLIKSAPLKYYWFRWASGDIGYDHPAAFHKYCRNEQDGRIHIYDELQVRRVGAYELGVLVAKWWLPELEALPDHQISLYLSPDAFSKTDATKTRAEQFEMGVKEVLGPYGAILMRFNDDERTAAMRDPKVAAAMFERRKQESQGKMCIAIRPANNDVDGGCSFMRDLFRWMPVLTETRDELRDRLRNTFQQAGVEAYERELARSANSGPEVLPKVQIWAVCRELDRCLKTAQHGEPPKHERYAKFDAQDGENGDDALDSCFIAGTMIETDVGSRPIEQVGVGDIVWTRAGLRPVTASGKTAQDASVFKVQFSDGSSLVGTGNHPIYVVDSGFVPLSSLRNGVMVESWHQRQPIRWSSTESHTADIPDQSISTFGRISGAAGTTESADSLLCIGTSGNTLTVPFLPDATFTIGTKTLSTTIPRISNASLSSTTSQGTPASMLSGLGPWQTSTVRLPKRGTLLQKVFAGIQSTVKKISKLSRLWLRPVSSAGKAIAPNGPINLNSAQTPANHVRAGNPAWITLKSLASSARSLFSRTDSTPSGTAPVHVLSVQPWGTASVYNLAVSHNPEYYANGILVHNCRYGAMAFKDIQTTIPKSYWLNERMGQIQDAAAVAQGAQITDINRLMQIQRTQAAMYDKRHQPTGGSMILPRHSSQRHRLN